MNRLTLNKKDIIEKDFNIEPQGYNAEEVDLFLDSVHKDYEIMEVIAQDYESKIDSLTSKIYEMENEIKSLETEKSILDANITKLKEQGLENRSILERISHIENVVGKMNKEKDTK